MRGNNEQDWLTSLVEIQNAIFEVGKDTIQSGGEIQCPIVIVVSKDLRTDYLPLDQLAQQVVRLAPDSISRFMAERRGVTDIIAIVTLAESWMVRTQRPDGDIGCQPRHHPDRVDALHSALLCRPSGRYYQRMMTGVVKESSEIDNRWVENVESMHMDFASEKDASPILSSNHGAMIINCKTIPIPDTTT